MFIPIEVKTGGYTEPQESHILQLAAYCHLLEENYNKFVPYGILIYSDISKFKIPFDPKTRFELESKIIVGSTREVLNIIEWLEVGVYIVTVTPNLVEKMIVHPYSKETVQMFLKDAENIKTMLKKNVD